MCHALFTSRSRGLIYALLAPALLACQPPIHEIARRVEIVRTEYGVPHILADDFEAMGFGLGYVQSEDYSARLHRPRRPRPRRAGLEPGRRCPLPPQPGCARKVGDPRFRCRPASRCPPAAAAPSLHLLPPGRLQRLGFPRHPHRVRPHHPAAQPAPQLGWRRPPRPSIRLDLLRSARPRSRRDRLLRRLPDRDRVRHHRRLQSPARLGHDQQFAHAVTGLPPARPPGTRGPRAPRWPAAASGASRHHRRLPHRSRRHRRRDPHIVAHPTRAGRPPHRGRHLHPQRPQGR